MEKINIRGVFFDNVTGGEAFYRAKYYIDSDYTKANAIYTPNAEIVQMCIEDETGGLTEIINSADLVIPDGAGVILASRILKTPLQEKVPGIELAYKIIKYLNEKKGRLFLLGSKDEILEKAVANLGGKYKNLIVCGTQNGFYDKKSSINDDIISKINECSPDVVFVCLGAPAQEKWIYENRDKIKSKILIGLGGTIDDIAGVVKRAPKIFIRLNLEWFYRLIKNPLRLGRMMRLPKFISGTRKYYREHKRR